MDEAYWDHIFTTFKAAISDRRKNLPAVSLIAAEYSDKPFAVLISTILSLRTKDEVTLEASKRLFSALPDVWSMDRAGEEEIMKLIYPSGFYKRKAGQIKTICRTLIEKYEGKVPSSAQELTRLPGVGIKTANLTLNLGFNIPAICVDCHVHQISNRLGWISTKTPEESVKALEAIMPVRYWIDLNELLVSYGQNICLSLSPLCSICPQEAACPKIGVKKHR